MPGVQIRTGATSGPAAPGRSPASTFFVVGQAERGPTDAPVRINSMSEFVRTFGVATTYSTLYDTMRAFFEEGGSRAYVVRVVGGAATKGQLASALQDRHATTPVSTLSVAASSEGAWSSRVSVKVLDGPITGVFRLQILLDGVVVEDYANLHTPAEAVAQVNDSTRASNYVRLTNMGSATTAPLNNPAVTPSPVALSAGTDDRAAIVTSDYTGALDLFTEGLGDGAVAVPGLGAAVHSGLIAHANTLNRIALLSEARSADSATLLATAAALDAPRAGLFAPWVKVPDGSGGTKVISPEGYIAAVRARAIDTTGPWRPAAGEVAKARWVLAPDIVLTNPNELDDGKVNAILTIAASVRNYGWRSLSTDSLNWRYLSSADVVNRVVVEAKRLLEPYVYAPVDDRGHLLAAIAGTLEGIVKPMADLGGLFGFLEEDETGESVERDPGYKIVVDGALNSRQVLAGNEVYAQLGLRPAPTAALIFLDVTKASVTAAL